MINSRNILQLTTRAVERSERWFPGLHRSTRTQVDHFVLGLVGEAGEVANLAKKVNRLLSTVEPEDEFHDSRLLLDSLKSHGIGAELADVLTYLLLLANALGVDLEREFEAKAAINEERFGRG